MLRNQRIQPLLKWAGGKEKELPQITPILPSKINRYFEPFVGGGAVFFAMNTTELFINDKSIELINLYSQIKNQSTEFFGILFSLQKKWLDVETFTETHSEYLSSLYANYSKDKLTEEDMKDQLNVFLDTYKTELACLIESPFDEFPDVFYKEVSKNLHRKTARMKKLEKEKGTLSHSDVLDNIETSFKSAFYMNIRYLYNQQNDFSDAFKAALFFFIREYCYSSMFRYNASGEFNVPYGGMSYNRKDFLKKINKMKSVDLLNHLNKTTIHNDDFEQFLIKTEPIEDDFIFLDPPYDSDFSTYANNIFDKEEQERLANHFIHNNKANFMMVIKNTEFIFNLYNGKTDANGKKINISSFDKKYLVSFQNRNNKDVEHLIITNY